MNINNCTELLVNDKFYQYDFSICTLVTRKNEYQEMLETFNDKGFTDKNSEFLYIDNSEINKADGYSGLNWFLAQSKGKYTIICHQDIRLEFDDIIKLQQCINEMNIIDPHWSVLGNAGGTCDFSKLHIRITHPYGENVKTSEFPIEVDSLDENFLVIKNGLNIGLSRDLQGFHFYGTDLCFQAKLQGYNAYVINFHLSHLSRGSMDKNFLASQRELIKKYETALRPKYVQTTCAFLYISGFRFLNLIFNNASLMKVKRRIDIYLKSPIIKKLKR